MFAFHFERLPHHQNHSKNHSIFHLNAITSKRLPWLDQKMVFATSPTTSSTFSGATHAPTGSHRHINTATTSTTSFLREKFFQNNFHYSYNNVFFRARDFSKTHRWFTTRFYFRVWLRGYPPGCCAFPTYPKGGGWAHVWKPRRRSDGAKCLELWYFARMLHG